MSGVLVVAGRIVTMTPNVQGFLLPPLAGQVVLIPDSYRGRVTRPYRTFTVLDFIIRLRYVRAGFSPVLLLIKDRKLKGYLLAGRLQLTR